MVSGGDVLEHDWISLGNTSSEMMPLFFPLRPSLGSKPGRTLSRENAKLTVFVRSQCPKSFSFSTIWDKAKSNQKISKV